MNSPFPETLQLHPRIALEWRQQRHVQWILGLMSVVLLATMALPLLKFAPEADFDWSKFAAGLFMALKNNPMDVLGGTLLVAVTIVYGFHFRFVGLRERLVLTRSGIRFDSPVPQWIPLVPKRWELSWGQISSVTMRAVMPGANMHGIVMEIRGRGRTYRLFPFRWVDPTAYRPVAARGISWRDVLRNSERLAADVNECPLRDYIASALPHIKLPPFSELVAKPFDIAKNPAAWKVTIVFFALLAYVFVDGGILLSETYAEEPPFVVFAVMGILATVAAGVFMKRGAVPWAETLIIALLLGSGAAGATYPALLRLNALTDMEGIRAHKYRATTGIEWQPLERGPPALSMTRNPCFWPQYKAGDVREFELRHGWLGFYQLHLAPLEKEWREHAERGGRRTKDCLRLSSTPSGHAWRSS